MNGIDNEKAYLQSTPIQRLEFNRTPSWSGLHAFLAFAAFATFTAFAAFFNLLRL
jgi:hypothetical protein